MGEKLEVPITILDEIWVKTLEVLMTEEEFKPETVEKIHKIMEKGKINPDSIIAALKE
ncbi:hypothetical protein [Methanobacterium paludis]|uniref:Uncharacterized protein n=1 Tax=Methanobacterium paludis (strain DSM 25820 / JCM 18151 / SWAN1) TaxID=868131 RepID=F6D1Q9_METPW|nr:hypothetical protein [Methanobacterium paludis]AEG17862.1 hypothetical protein MSWAN_0835 [Methanobacterium paludis]